MSEVRLRIGASPERIFEVLADGWLYSNWVVGTSHMRAVEHGWPAVGTTLHHATGLWPLVTRDATVVEDYQPPTRLVLLAHGGPLGSARVTMTVQPEGPGASTVAMDERPVSGPGKWLDNPLIHAAIARRNVESLHRLRVLAEHPEAPVD